MTSPSAYLDEQIRAMTPSAEDRSAASTNRSSIEVAVKGELDAFRIFETGSWSHGTAVRVWSDVDYFVSMRHVRPLRSYDDLVTLRRALDEWVGYRARSVSIHRPGVTIDWPDGPPTEIIPAHITSDGDYWIPDPQGSGWIKSNPEKHNEYVNESRDKVARAKEFVRLVKLWKYRRSVPITSLYLELRAAKYLREHPPFHVVYDFAGFFRHLDTLGLAAMNDPSRFDGRRISAASDTSLPAARSAVTKARIHADFATSYLGSNDSLAVGHLANIVGLS
jgi:hypothetical protein